MAIELLVPGEHLVEVHFVPERLFVLPEPFEAQTASAKPEAITSIFLLLYYKDMQIILVHRSNVA